MGTTIAIGIVIVVIIVIFAAVSEKNKQASFQKATGLQFTPTKRITSNSGLPIAEFDDLSKQCRFYGTWGNSEFYPYSSIVAFELLEDGESKVSGGLGRALVGGALFGGVGAVVGGVTGTKTTRGICKNLRIKVTVNNMSNPVVYLTFGDDSFGVEKSSSKFKKSYSIAQECLSVLQLICDIQNQSPPEPIVMTELPQEPINNDNIPTTAMTSSADEIRKLKSLLDSGVITDEEFVIAKKNLLGM